MTPENFAEVARVVFARRDGGYKNKTQAAEDKEICQSFIGTSFEVCAELWGLISLTQTLPNGAKPKHLLWALLHMKNYATDSMSARVVGGVCVETFRKWSQSFVSVLNNLEGEVVRRALIVSIIYS